MFLQSHIRYLFYRYWVEKPPVTNLLHSCCTRVRAGVCNCPVSQMYSIYLNFPVAVSCLTCCTERAEPGRVEVMTVDFLSVNLWGDKVAWFAIRQPGTVAEDIISFSRLSFWKNQEPFNIQYILLNLLWLSLSQLKRRSLMAFNSSDKNKGLSRASLSPSSYPACSCTGNPLRWKTQSGLQRQLPAVLAWAAEEGCSRPGPSYQGEASSFGSIFHLMAMGRSPALGYCSLSFVAEETQLRLWKDLCDRWCWNSPPFFFFLFMQKGGAIALSLQFQKV